MGGPNAGRVVLAAALLTAAFACSSSSADKAGPTATVRTEPPAPATTVTTNPYAVPAVIDAAYVNRVLAGLDGVMGDATRILIGSKTITSGTYDRLRAIYANNSLLQLVVDAMADESRKNFSGYKPNPGNRVTTVTRIMTGHSSCVFARVERDHSPMSPTPSPSETQYVALMPLDHSRDPHGYNRTAWALTFDGFTRDRSEPENPCLR